ncbi:MAG: hypothetical protein K2H14_03950, partial [Muribaculaceae bacterium]|nr:hypothetical protein [Muribaculaceae bacterium]
MEVSVRLSYTSTAGYDGTLTIIDGATATFSDQWIMDITDPATRNLGIVVDENHKNILRFTKELSFSGGDYVDLIVNVKQITFPSQVSQGQGLYAPGMFDMQV